MTDSERAELVRIVERLGRPEARDAMVNLMKQIGAFGLAMVKNWSKMALLLSNRKTERKL